MDFALAKKRDYFVKRDPQIGLAYLASSLRQEGVEPQILDFSHTFLEKEDFAVYIKIEKPLFVGFYAATAIKSRVIEYIKHLKKEIWGVKICVGGPDMFAFQDYLNAGADLYCMGEGDLTIKEIYKYYKGEIPIEAADGISSKNDSGFQTTTRELIKDLDSLPIPAWDLYDLSKYYNYHIF